MQVHHEKELEHLKRMMDRREEDLVKNQTLERKALPKRIRQEMRAREMMFRESMRISTPNIHEMLKPTEEKERIKKVGLFKRTSNSIQGFSNDTTAVMIDIIDFL